MKQQHVRAWNQAKKHPAYRHRRNGTLEDACDRLIDQWLLFSSRWQIEACGRTWEGVLSHANYADDVFFTITITDPDDSNRTIAITAPFELFVELGETSPVLNDQVCFTRKGESKNE